MSLTFRKNRSSNFIPYFLLTSFVCGALGGDGLFAATSVTMKNGFRIMPEAVLFF